jgi:hypothetical protein
MGGGDLNLKKSWHPSTLKNIEKVFLKERAADEEKKKMAQLQKELNEQRQMKELQELQEASGKVKLVFVLFLSLLSLSSLFLLSFLSSLYSLSLLFSSLSFCSILLYFYSLLYFSQKLSSHYNLNLSHPCKNTQQGSAKKS